MTEADTCRKYVVPKLVAVGWEDELDSSEEVEQEGAEEAETLSAIRGERADLKRERQDFFDRFGPEARAVLNDLLDKYTEHGATQFQFPDALKIPPISERGSVMEIARYFGGSDHLRAAVSELQSILYAA